MKKYLNLSIKIIISSLIVLYLFTKINLADVINVLKEIDLFYFIIGLIVICLCWLVNTKKWQNILKYLGFKEKIARLFKLNLISVFYSSILPGGQLTGEGIKCYKIIKGNDKKGRLFYSVLMDKITGLIGLCILGFLGIIITNSIILNYNKIFYFLFSSFVVSIIIIFLFNKQAADWLKKIYLKILINKKEGRAEKIIDIIFIFKDNYRALFNLLLYSLISQFLNTLSVYFLALSLNVNLTIIDLLWINALISIALIIPITFLGIGVREVSFVFLLSLLGISNAQSLSLSLLVSFSIFLFGLTGGLFELRSFLHVEKKPLYNEELN
jgi:uncharacterized protein (TIRG00374 family)